MKNVIIVIIVKMIIHIDVVVLRNPLMFMMYIYIDARLKFDVDNGATNTTFSKCTRSAMLFLIPAVHFNMLILTNNTTNQPVAPL